MSDLDPLFVMLRRAGPLANDYMSKPGRWNGQDVSAPKPQLTPAQIDAFRPKPMADHIIRSLAQQSCALAYKTGIAPLQPIILRLLITEKAVVDLQAAVAALEAKV